MIDKIGKACTGCYACANACPKSCIHMKTDREGFWYPRFDPDQCIRCGRCVNACPVLSEIPNSKTEKDIRVYAVTHQDESIRMNSSSGGAFTALAETVLEQGGVVFGAAFTKNFDVHHIYVETAEDLAKLRGSKYVQSKIGDTFKQAEKFLKEGRPVYFSGTACQTSGLIGYLGRDYDNLYTQDLICHGVPSPMVWRKYLEYHQTLERSGIKRIFLRDKAHGWHNWHVAIDFNNGTHYTQSQFQDKMIVSFLRGKCSRPCCYDCRFKQKCRTADFTLADYWGIQEIAPELDDDKGISSCYVNSPKAQKLFDIARTRLEVTELDLDRSVAGNLAMIDSERLPKDREAYLGEMRKRPFEMVYGKYIDEMSKGTELRWMLRRALGSKRYDFIRTLGRKRK